MSDSTVQYASMDSPLATADGALALTDIQLAGKKRMDVKSFLLGFREPTSYTTSQGTSKAEIEKTKPKDED
jgi:methionyl-tRNA formyltransferase